MARATDGTPTDRRRPPIPVKPPAVLTGLFILALGYTLYFAAQLLIPITISIFLSILFFPVVRTLARYGIPRVLSSALIVTCVVLVVGLAISTLSRPAEQWVREAPHSIRQFKQELLRASENIDDIQALAKEMEGLTDVEDGYDPEAPQPVVVMDPGVFQEFVGSLPLLIGTSVVMMFMTFFMLVSGDALLLKVTRWGRTFSERKQIVTIARRFQADLSRYLATVTIVNSVLGCTTALALYLLDVPNPVLWGTMVGVFNFAPYVGALVSTLVLTVVGLMTFSSLPEALLVPGSFLVLTTLEGQLITPAIVGRNMSINPLMVLLSVVVWGWIWGIAGALMAVPIMASFRAVCEHYPPLYHVGALLTNEAEQRRNGRQKRQAERADPQTAK